jgi:beta-carotene hydroxylase
VSISEERTIAQKFIGGFPLLMVVWGLGGFIVWLALWPLVILGHFPLWLGGVIATVILSACYLPSHEAEHGNIGRPKKPFRWLNELIGHLSMFPLLIPYRLHRAVHLKHHAYANNPDKDPDFHHMADNIAGAVRQAWLSTQPTANAALQDGVLDDGPAKDKLIIEALVVTRIAWILMATLALSGYALELFALWWLPRQIAMIYTILTLSWAPHHPAREQGRYRDTRGWVSPVGTILSSGMEYHLVHHLFPSIPLNKTPAAYRALKPLLEKEGMALNGL